MQTWLRSSDWTALLVKRPVAIESMQRTGRVEWLSRHVVQSWLPHENALGSNIYICINALKQRARSRRTCDVAAIRHVFLDVDVALQEVLSSIERRSYVPPPSYVVHTSANRAHVLWCVQEFDVSVAERVQKQLAIALGGDRAATSVAQMTRLPGFWNHKHREPYLVWFDYRDVEHVYTPRDFPSAGGPEPVRPEPVGPERPALGYRDSAERALAYLSQVPPAVAVTCRSSSDQ